MFLFTGSAILPSATADDLFAKHVAPLLQKHCVGCHNDNDLDGELSLQSASSLLKGGESGEIVVPGKPGESSLLDYISGDDPEMPKDADPLTKQDIDHIRKWIEQGAKWPDGTRLDYQTGISKDWWALKAPKRPALGEEVANPIDYFVARKHKAKGFSFAAPADRRVLIRRLYFDLIGLPPTPERTESFVSSTDPQAYEKLVDELLASQRYGERWARHWLDVVQYGETHGYDKDKPRKNAWPYRDYVIRALNDDKPYSRFVREQLAGDALFPDTPDGIVATGFISAGPWDFIGHAEVPETKTDGQVARNLDRDNMVTSTMNTFCSLTIQCARCHNHKLDPVTMEEYYNLQSVFAAIDRADREYDLDPQTAKERAALMEKKSQATQSLVKLQKAIDSKKSDELKKIEAQIKSLNDRIAKSAFAKPALPKSRRMGYHSQVARKQDDAKWVQVDLGQPTDIDSILLTGAVEYGHDDFGFPHRFVVEASSTADFKNSLVVSDHRDHDFARPGNLPVVIKPDSPVSARFVRITATKLWSRHVKGSPKTNDWIFALGELSVISNDRVAAVREVTALDSIEALPGWSRKNLVDHLFGGNDLETKLGKKESPTNGYHSLFASGPNHTKWVQLTFEKSRPIEQVRIYPAYPTDFQDTPGFGFPVRFRVEGSSDPEFSRPVLLLDQTKRDFENPLLKPLVVQVDSGKELRHVRITATKLWNRGDAGDQNHALALSEVELFASGKNIANEAKVTASDSINSGRWHSDYLIDGFTSRLPLDKRLPYFTSVGRDQEFQAQLSRLTEKQKKLFQESVGQELLDRRSSTQAELASINQAIGKLPKPSRVYAGTVHHGSGAFRGRGGLGPREIYVLHRGDVTRKKEKAVPGTVDYIPAAKPVFQLSENHVESDRRTALAEWIVRHDNPLTWRSIVNRVWQYHFDRGIVDTPNDFGRGGSLPTHPELLDWLAVEFRDGGKYLTKQSLKSLHRLICNSRTYKQVSTTTQYSDQDRDNQYLWRMNRRRLSAEEIHDSVLQAAGILDLKMGGPSYKDFVVERPEHSPHYEYHLHDPNDPATHRRAVYRFIVRSQPQPFMDTLNCADPSSSVPKRAETLTALQALGMLNNNFMVAMAERFSQRLEKNSKTLRDQIVNGYELITGRKPGADELELLEQYGKQHGLKNLCRVYFNLNGFIFVD